MGGPGSGRAEQCEMIVDRYPGSVHVSMGELLREQTSKLASSDMKWSTIKRLMDEGNMVPEDVTQELLLPELKKHSGASGIILSGFPRTKEQVELFNGSVGGLTTAILLDSDDHRMKQRLRSRRDKSGREDDSPLAVTNRLTYYKHHTLPIIGYLDSVQQLVVVNTDRDADEVFTEVSAELDKFLRPSNKPKTWFTSQSAEKGSEKRPKYSEM
ncbi:adenylate kinase [Lamellibrachia satsuma]|nr:adenylate kinase [Lamellibrachia satsuma]